MAVRVAVTFDLSSYSAFVMSRFALFLLTFCLAAVLYVACSGVQPGDEPMPSLGEVGARCPEGLFDASAFPPPATGDQVRIATLNTEFLFDGIDGDGRASFAWKDDPESSPRSTWPASPT